METLTTEGVASLAFHTREVMGKPLIPMLQVQEGSQVKLAALTGYNGRAQLRKGLAYAAETFPEAETFFLTLEEEGIIRVWKLDLPQLLAWPMTKGVELVELKLEEP